MAIGPLVNLASSVVQSLFSKPAAASGPTASNPVQDTNRLSPFAQVLSSLQQLQHSNPAQYRTVAQQISNNLQTAAQSATAKADTDQAARLTRLSTDFTNASSSGQVPNLQDLARAVGGHHHPATSDLSALYQALNGSQRSSPDALAIIGNTLSSAGIQVR